MSKIFHKNKYNKGPTSTQGGFTLIELIVAISIFAILSSIMVFNYGSFKSSLSIQNLADDIALSVRKAQGYAIGVHSSDTNNSFTSGYGVHFSTAIPTSDSISKNAGSNKSFILFANIDNPTEYNNSSGCGNPTSTNECLEVLNITSSDKISAISAVNNMGENEVDTLDIFFKRPQPEPTFCARKNGNPACISGNSVSSVKITISNDNGISKIITISNVGQISVSNN